MATFDSGAFSAVADFFQSNDDDNNNNNNDATNEEPVAAIGDIHIGRSRLGVGAIAAPKKTVLDEHQQKLRMKLVRKKKRRRHDGNEDSDSDDDDDEAVEEEESSDDEEEGRTSIVKVAAVDKTKAKALALEEMDAAATEESSSGKKKKKKKKGKKERAKEKSAQENKDEKVADNNGVSAVSPMSGETTNGLAATDGNALTNEGTEGWDEGVAPGFTKAKFRRPKKRSKQKNIRKDNRSADQKPSYLIPGRNDYAGRPITPETRVKLGLPEKEQIPFDSKPRRWNMVDGYDEVGTGLAIDDFGKEIENVPTSSGSKKRKKKKKSKVSRYKNLR